MFNFKTIATSVALACLGSFAAAQSWTLNPDASHVAFGSVKKDTVGEVHSFEQVSGAVNAKGEVAVEIDLASVETFIDIRNERMVEFVFQKSPKAMISANIDMAEVSSLSVGESTVVNATGTINLVGSTVELDAEMFVMRVSDSRVLVNTQDMIMLGMADAGLTAGIDKLMELASLPGITRVSPVTLRLVFDADQQDATAAPTTAEATQVALVGDAGAGKKVFRKCKACHQLKEGKNGVGPSLHQIVGKPAGSVDGFRYSDVMAGSGVTWTPEAIAGYLADPKAFMPGNKMAFRGLRKDADIENVIAYIASES
ncbi:MAG: c-type cytochrome [Sulfitobacter sp.]